MAIDTFRNLLLYIKIDGIMNEPYWPHGFIKRLLFPNPVEKFMKLMRIAEYLNLKEEKNKLWRPLYIFFKIKYLRASIKCGFEIPLHTLGYGCIIPHRCGIIINNNTTIGNYCCLYRSTFADGHTKHIGNNVFVGTNVVVCNETNIADGCTISAMSLVNRSFEVPNQLVGGVPAKSLNKAYKSWTYSYKPFIRAEKYRKKILADNHENLRQN